MDTVRAFVGCLLDLTVTRRVLDLQRRVRARLDEAGVPARWVPAPNLHVTLCFLGDVDAGLVPALADELTAECRKHPVLRPVARGLGVFPDTRAPRVLYADLSEGSSELVALSRALDARFETLGLAPPQRLLHPHVTLARCEPAHADALADAMARAGDAECGKAYLTEISLYRSDLLRAGSEYHVLHRAPLGVQNAPQNSGPARRR